MVDRSDANGYQFDFTGYDAEKTRRSVRTHNSNFSSHYDHLRSIYNVCKDAPSTEAADEMTTAQANVHRSHAALLAGYEHLVTLEPGKKNEDARDKAVSELTTQKNDADVMALTAYGLCKPLPTPQQPQPAAVTCKPNQALKPDTLTTASKPSEFTTWLEKFRTYYSSSRMSHATREEQHQYLYACISQDLYNRVKLKVNANAPVFTTRDATHDSIMALLTREFRNLYPLSARRFEWLNRKFSGSWSSYYAEMKMLAKAADYINMTQEDFFAYSLICNLPEGDMRSEMLRLDRPSSDDLDRIGQQFDRQLSASSLLPSAQAPAKAFATSQARHPQQGNKGQQQQPPRAADWQTYRPDLADKCKRCADPKCPNGKLCPAKKERCAFCKARGHIVQACIKKAKASASNARSVDAQQQQQASQQAPPQQQLYAPSQPSHQQLALEYVQQYQQQQHLPVLSQSQARANVITIPAAKAIKNKATPPLGL